MDVSEPSAAVCPTLDGPVLIALARTTRPLSAREVSRLTKRGSWEGVRRVLLRLAEHGIVTVEQVGNVTQYRINRSHVAFPVVERLAGLRSELFRRLSEEIAGWEISPLHASVFGSAARGDGGTASDIDLFIVRPHEVDADDRRWREQLDSLSRRVRDWTGNHAALAELSEDEARQARFSETVREMRSEGIPLAGVRIEELLEAVP